ncbi:MAG: hydantoinase/oxoprolinase family protein [Gemmatimonadota bacterium]
MSAPMSQGAGGPSTALLAVDTGGTFTDLVLRTEAGIRTLKLPSTPADPSEAVLAGIDELLGDGDPFVLLHGSTVATNALLERRGARVVLVTNEGFEDVIEIGRQNRPQLYALVGHRPPPLVARDDRIGIAGRLGPDGAEVEPVDPEELAGLAARVRELGGEAVAICLLHAYADPAHERAVAGALTDVGVPVSVSSSVLPEFREYERTSTTVVNAYVTPVMDRYLGRLEAESGAVRTTIMGSNGGALPVARARREPVHTVLSGPAGGVMGALAWARRAGHDGIVTFDMGGTSTDVSLCPGRPLRTREFEIGGSPVAVPVIDIHTVGAGGGSLARVDAGGALRVGPESSGATPGPICYGNGGTEVTVTDAHVWLGTLPADGFLGGARTLDREAVRAPLTELATALGTSLEEAAEGVLTVADTAMERALRVISVERGYDPIDFTVVAFGGAGGLHVAELTGRLGASRAMVPPDPGLLSAYGMLAAPLTHEASRTVLVREDAPDARDRVERALAELEREARAAIAADLPDADGGEGLTTERWIDARYRGQSFELAVPADGWAARFHAAHEERYGYRRDDIPAEAVTVRVVVTAATPELDPPELPEATEPPPLSNLEVFHRGQRLTASRVERSALGAGHRLDGPLVVQEYSGTTWVPPEWTVEVDRWGTLHLEPSR